ncbi:MAG: c-di-GMP-related signal transduction protein [Pseudoalteromonas rhizosphaerae]|jgi:c-di-GMP-related signal transduction protein|uniref:HDOD domain-containing protein n=1 Tax=Pseudoalteromonas neustonica TaxID=1840331 RepID=A0ABY3FCH1_9GAMM|nr:MULTISPECIES: HDOD domain-containing protein [Pseudoalteromonas]MBB1293627.1 HDOD domain-containing protein [Pseudoalteromonas sp. SR41-4]MBB1397601.1 HDOD domain-containing protein [Pseudoalteromonas sp. SG44-8]MBB1409266.1 HDOD domain-containing protein [Pseudoalteromonas sp. SG44-17]MBB1504976.1 HDOD domain-containing protein [Pseudoalteromonas sp. SG41-1]TVU82355.1 HDOD domain-containing protein [Pseudoalteromonas neustonica]|tara:strand:+ start:9337 stop:10560 length:1224 start_codon:yes stop_codon:yes gene_type:complete
MYFYAARQPILDRNKQLVGYELLFRDGVDNVFPDIDGDEATSRLIEGSQFNFGLEDLTDNKPAYINFTLETLQKGYPTLLGKDQIVVEILETIQPGKRLLAIVKDLKQKGYTLALDDYIHQPVWRHFYPFIDIIKIDFLNCEVDTIHSIIEEIKPYPHIKLLAEKVETYEKYQLALDLGFTYFQGFFFSKPEMVQSKTLPPSEIALAELLYETSTVEVNLKKITDVFERDVNLSYKLLRYSNSAAFKRRAEISTIKQALIVLGAAEIKKFLSLLFAAQVAGDKPAELIRLSLTRARFTELLAINHSKLKDTGMAFLTGMMSLMDAILDEDMESVMNKLPLSNDIKLALLEDQGLLAQYLRLVKLYEQANWQGANAIKDELGLTAGKVPDAYHDAVNWANEQMKVLAG